MSTPLRSPVDIGKDFVVFYRALRKSLYGDTKALELEVASPEEQVKYLSAFDFDSPEGLASAMQAVWSDTGPAWLGIESEFTIEMTMLTFFTWLANIQIPQQKRIRIISLGTGPCAYEIFLAHELVCAGFDPVVTCVDYAQGMLNIAGDILKEKIIGKVTMGPLRERIRLVCASMEDLSVFHSRKPGFDIVLCNNALQWSLDWRRVITQIPGLIHQKGLRQFFLAIHTHAMQLKIPHSGRRISLPPAEGADVLDAVEKSGFDIEAMRILKAPNGFGQAGMSVSRQFIRGYYQPGGATYSWRERERTRSGTATFFNAPKPQ